MLLLVLTVQLAHLAYHQVTTLVDFYPFNNIRCYTRREMLIEASVNGVLLLIPPFAFVLQHRVLMGIGTGIYAVLFLGEIVTWWVPYFRGASEKWQGIYDRIFHETWRVLPPRGRNPVPNLEHTILHSLTLTSLILSVAYLLAGHP
jgi:hypothetical protein